MPYTFKPKEEHAKAYGDNLVISTKNAIIVCRAINNKKLAVARRLLEGLISEKRSLGGKHYTKAATEILSLLESCEKNADFMGLENDKLFIHAGATHGSVRRRRRRKAAFGSRMKMSNVEIILIQRGKGMKKAAPEKKGLKEKLKKTLGEEEKPISKSEKDKNRERRIEAELGKAI